MKIINIKTYRVFRERAKEQKEYLDSLLKMAKPDLLQELLTYHETYRKDPYNIEVTIRGQMLIEVLEKRADLKELQELLEELQIRLEQRLNSQLNYYNILSQ